MYPEIRQAKGSYLFDKNGKRYINLSESINILGHKDHELLSLIHSRLDTKILHYPLTISRQPAADELETKLRNLTGIYDGEAVYSSSGSEACDVALSILSHFGPVITLKGGYQGLSGQYLKKGKYDRLEYGREFNLSFPDTGAVLEELRHLVNQGAKSIIIEELQVEAGVREVYSGFLKDVRETFPKLLMCIDESYTGIGKTGKLFSYQWQDVVPDMVIIGKAIGGGIPLGVTFLHRDMLDETKNTMNFRNNSFGSTSGNLLALDVANYLLDKVSNGNFLQEVNEKGEHFKRMLGSELSDSTRGRGLILGIKIEERLIVDYITKILEDGVYVTRMNDVIRISPPLTISYDLLREAGSKIKKAIEST